MDFSMLLMLFGGLGLFLYGMKLMGDGLERAAGPSLKALLGKLTNNRFMAMLLGVVVTALVQSSSATTVMVVGFVNAQLMSLGQAVGIIMGANIGTTITSQIIAFNTTTLSYILAIIGAGLSLFAKKRSHKHIGVIFVGLAILFVGMQTMSTAMVPLREVLWFRELIASFKNPLVGILAGALFTAIIQSSSASVGILQAIAMQGIVGLDSAIFVILGQNIGTCITALLSSIGASRNARRAAIIHLLYNVIGTLIFVPIVLFTPFVALVTGLTPDKAVNQIANAHTIFNVLTTLVLLPFAGLLVKLSCLIVQGEDPASTEDDMRLEFVDERILEAPTVAVSTLRKEIDRMCAVSLRNLDYALDAFITGNLENQEKIMYSEKLVNFLNKELTRYLVKVNALELSDADAASLAAFYHVIGDIERIGDHAENIIEYAQIKNEHNVPFSETAISEIVDMKQRVDKIIADALTLFDKGISDKQLEMRIVVAEEAIDERTRVCRDNHIQRLSAGKCSPESGMMFIDLLSDLERAADHATNIAFALIKH